MKRKICRVLYELIGKHLPRQCYIGGRISRKIRYVLVKGYIENCGESVNFEHGATISSKVSIGNYSGIGVNADIAEGVTIGDYVMMGPNCKIYTQNHKHEFTETPFLKQGYEAVKPVVIGNNVWIGGVLLYYPEKL